MAIEFNCPECKASMRVPDMHAGKKGHCPACRSVIHIPQAAGAAPPETPAKADSETVTPELTQPASAPVKAPEPVAVAATAAPAPVAEAASASSAYIKFNCPGCGKMTGFPSKFAGTPMACPSCKVKVMVPERSGEESFIVGAVLEEKGKAQKYKYVEPAKKAAPEKPAAVAVPAPAAAAAHVAKPAKPAHKPEKSEKIPLPIILGGVFALGVAVTLVFLYTRQTPASATAELERKSIKPPSDEKKAPVTTPAPAVPDAPKEAPPKQAPTPAPAAEQPKVADNGADSVEIGVAKPPPQEIPSDLSAKRDPKSTRGDDDTDTTPTPKRVESPKEEPGFGVPPPVTTLPAQPAQAAKPAPQVVQNAPKPPAPKLPEGPCPQCMGTGFMPILPPRPYIQTGQQATNSNNAAAAVPWRYCTKCGAANDPQALITAETIRINAIAAANQTLEQATGLHVLYGETRHVGVHTTMPESEARQTIAALDDLTSKLQQATTNTILVQTRPDSCELMIGWDEGGHRAFLAAAGINSTSNVMNENRGIFCANHGIGIHPKQMALYNFGYMLIQRACGNRAPIWLRLGFASYCENLVTRKNYVYAFTYEKNEVKFGDNWDLEIKRYASQGRLKTWDQIFPVDAIGMKALDYLTIYSMVEYMMSTDPKQFTKLCLAFKDGMTSEEAIQKTYGRDWKQMQQLWSQWALSK